MATPRSRAGILELAVRAAYPLVVSGRLNADRGSSRNDQPDRRTPGEVLDAMRRSLHGVRQLGQALTGLRAVTTASRGRRGRPGEAYLGRFVGSDAERRLSAP